MVVSPSKTPVIHNSTFLSSQYARNVNADTGFAQPPPVELGCVLRNIIWCILYLRRRFGSRTRVVLSRIDVTEAFQLVSVQWAGAPVFGYAFRELVVADRRLQFGWRSSTRVFCLFSAALKHAHRHTSYDDAVVVKQGRSATEHVLGHPTESDRWARSVATWLPGPPRSGRVEEEPVFCTILRRRGDIGGITRVTR